MVYFDILNDPATEIPKSLYLSNFLRHFQPSLWRGGGERLPMGDLRRERPFDFTKEINPFRKEIVIKIATSY